MPILGHPVRKQLRDLRKTAHTNPQRRSLGHLPACSNTRTVSIQIAREPSDGAGQITRGRISPA